MEDSILDSTKKALQIEVDDTSFDDELIMHINSVFSKLNQLGMKPVGGFEIEDRSEQWSVYLTGGITFNFIKTYMYDSVRLIFDPPTTSFAIDAIKKRIDEAEWRINVAAEGSVH